MKHFCKISFEGFGNYRNLKLYMHVQELLRRPYVHGHERPLNFFSDYSLLGLTINAIE